MQRSHVEGLLGRDIMTGLANSAVHHARSVALSEEQIFRLWCAAVKDDDKQLDEVIQRVYRDMIKQDRERFEEVMYLAITRDVSAERALAELLNDIPASSATVPLH
jgi:hypothetical protein